MILKTMDGITVPITKQEEEALKKALASGSSHISFRGAIIPRSGMALYPDEMWATRNNIAKLHDGTMVERKFGRWVDMRNPDVTLSLEHYPELAKDEVLTPAEWEAAGIGAIETEEARLIAYTHALERRAEGFDPTSRLEHKDSRKMIA